MQHLKAVVRNGRLVLDEPTDLPEGAEVALITLEGARHIAATEDDSQLNQAENVAAWASWRARGPQGPIEDDGAPELP
jgi:hypothetical protein